MKDYNFDNRQFMLWELKHKKFISFLAKIILWLRKRY
jgi:hypothetical protein